MYQKKSLAVRITLLVLFSNEGCIPVLDIFLQKGTFKGICHFLRDSITYNKMLKSILVVTFVKMEKGKGVPINNTKKHNLRTISQLL